MKLDAPTNVIAIIGAFTGSLGLFLQTIGYLLKRPKIKCEKDTLFDSYWDKSSNLMIESHPISTAESIYKSTDLIAISLIIKNKRNLPITIESIEIKNGFKSSPDVKFKNPHFKNGFYLIPAKENKFPIRLDCYDVINLSVIYLLYPQDDNSKQNIKSRKETVIVKTPYKNFKFKFKIDYASNAIRQKKLKDYKSTLIAAMDQNIDITTDWYKLENHSQYFPIKINIPKPFINW